MVTKKELHFLSKMKVAHLLRVCWQVHALLLRQRKHQPCLQMSILQFKCEHLLSQFHKLREDHLPVLVYGERGMDSLLLAGCEGVAHVVQCLGEGGRW